MRRNAAVTVMTSTKLMMKMTMIMMMIMMTLMSSALVNGVPTTQRGNRSGNGPNSARVLVLQESGEPSARSYARLVTPFPELFSFTICYRIQMYRFREETTLISYAVDNTKDNELRFDHRVAEYKVALHSQWMRSPLVTPIRYWAHFCLTMNADVGEWVMFLDGRPYGRGQYPTPVEPIPGGGVLIIGQEQDVVGGGFHQDQSYSGEVTELNIWKSVLDDETISKLANCEIFIEGDALSWARQSWQVYGETSWAGRSREILCDPATRRVTFFPDRFPLPQAIHLCQTVGGNLTVPVTLAENTWLYEGTVSKASFCSGGMGSAYMWLGAHDNAQEGQWVYIASGLPISWEGPWRGGAPNGGTEENCLVMLYGDFPSRWSDISCIDSYSFCVSCEFSKRSTLHLKGPGVCETSPFNRQYILQGESGGKPALSGFFHSEIKYDSDAAAWVIKSLKVDGATAHWTPVKSGEYPFGTKPWTLGYDICGLRNGDVINMTLSVCGEGQFTCADGTCIDLAYRCDLREDCPDMSDETQCSLLDIPAEYQKSVPPPSPRGKKSLPINFSINIVSFSSILTQEQTLGIHLEIILTWMDKRLNFLNLKSDRSLNLLATETMRSIWTPRVSFRNAHGNVFAQIGEGSRVECIREGPARTGGPSLPEEVTIYSGNENSLELREMYSLTYSCNFDLGMFPFDVQVCSLHFSLTSASSNYLVLQEGQAKYTGKTELIEYSVDNVSLSRGKDNQFSSMRVDVRFSRRYGFYILTVFLPTTFIVIVAYGTFFYKITSFQPRMLVSLASLLALSSVFTQASSNVPKTSYCKMLDIWFFFCIILNFAIVLFHMLIEYTGPETSHKFHSNHNGVANGIVRVQPTSQRPLSVKNGLVGTDPEPLNQYPKLGQNNYPHMGPSDVHGPHGPRGPGVWPNHLLLLMGARISVPVTYVIFNFVYWGSALKEPDTT